MGGAPGGGTTAKFLESACRGRRESHARAAEGSGSDTLSPRVRRMRAYRTKADKQTIGAAEGPGCGAVRRSGAPGERRHERPMAIPCPRRTRHGRDAHPAGIGLFRHPDNRPHPPHPHHPHHLPHLPQSPGIQAPASLGSGGAGREPGSFRLLSESILIAVRISDPKRIDGPVMGG